MWYGALQRLQREPYRRGLGTLLATIYGVSPSTVMLIVTGRIRKTAGVQSLPCALDYLNSAGYFLSRRLKTPLRTLSS